MPDNPDDLERLSALKPYFRYSLKEVRTVLPLRDNNHVRQVVFRYKRLLSPPEYVYDDKMRRHRTVSLKDIEVLRSVYKPKLNSYLNLVRTWAE